MILKYKGVSIFYKDEGHGAAVIFLHGFLESSNMWNDLIINLKKKFRCVSIDLLGHGKSEVRSDVHTMEMMAESVAAVINDLSIEKPIIIGHSMGGYVALAFASIAPDSISGLLLINSTAMADSDEKKKIRDRAVQVIRTDKRLFISMAISNLFPQNYLAVYAEEINQLKEEAYAMSVKGIVAATLGMKIRQERKGVLKDLPCKKWIVLGEQDSILNLEDQNNYLRAMNTKVLVLSGGHMLHIEDKYELTYIIKRFIEK